MDDDRDSICPDVIIESRPLRAAPAPHIDCPMAHSEYRPRRKRKKSWLGRIFLWSIVVVVALIAAAVIATPWILRAGVPEAFARFGMQASVKGGRLSLLRQEIALEGFVLGAPDAPALSLGELGVGLELLALVEGRVKLRHIRVKNVGIDGERLLALRKLGESGSTSSAQPLTLEFDKVELQDVRLVSLAERLGYEARIDRLAIDDLSALLADKTSGVELQGTIGDGHINLQLEVTLEKQDVRATGNYRIDKVPAQGWALLAQGKQDPLSGGAISGRGAVVAAYGLEAQRLDLTLDGRVSVAGLGLDVAPVQAERSDADWQGRLALQWSPAMATPTLRGDGRLEVGSLHLAVASGAHPLLQATIDDLSWRGDFNWQDGFSSQGNILGTGIQARDASSAEPAWQSRAEDFSWRLHADVDGGSGAFAARIQDFDLARISMQAAGGGAPVDVVADKVAVDEVRAAQSGDLVLGLATVDTLAISVSDGASAADAAKVRLGGLAANGLIGELSGKLHAARVSAESVDYAQSGRRLRAESIAFTSVGFRVPAWAGADQLTVKSVRADAGRGDVWLSGLQANRIHGDADGRFGVQAVDVTHLFQSGSSKLSWDAADLKLRGIEGDATDSALVEEVRLAGVKIGIDETSWDASGLHTKDAAVSLDGHVKLASFEIAKLERRQPSSGELQVEELDASALSVAAGRAVLERVKARSLDYRLHTGEGFQLHALEARQLGADADHGLEVRQLGVASADGHLVGGARLSAAVLDSHELSVATNGAVTVQRATLERFAQTGADTGRLHVDGARVAAIQWAPDTGLSTAEAAVDGALYTRADGGVGWKLASLDTRKLDWDGDAGIRAERMTLHALSQLQGKSRDWRAQELRATGLRLVLPANVNVQTLSAESADGGRASLAWKLNSLQGEELASSPDHGQTIRRLASGVLTVTDDRNHAALDVARIEIEAAGVSTLKEVSAGSLVVNNLRLRSDEPDWPARLTLGRLQVVKSLLRFDGVVELGAVVATKPYLIVARRKDNAWMWPPFPGAGGADKSAAEAQSKGGLRVASFVTSGPGRVVYIDRGTEPAAHLVLDPLVVAMENLNTQLPGNQAHFRARGTGAAFATVSLEGTLTQRVAGHDLGMQLTVKGADLPTFNPYIARHESLAVTAGRGDAVGKIAIESNEMSGDVHVLLSGLEIASTVGGTTFEVIDPANFPIRTALALLKDRYGDISLTVPLDARTASPRFDVVDEFQAHFVRAITAAGKVAANLPGKTLNRAMNLLEGTISLLPGVDAERYAPVEFADGADDFSAGSLVYLDQLGKRMAQHGSLALALCGRSVAMDADAISEPATGIDTLFADARKGVYPRFASDRDGLLALARARADNVRHYLRNVHKIPAERLASCAALVDDAAGAKPRVVLQVKTPAKRKGLFGIFP